MNKMKVILAITLWNTTKGVRKFIQTKQFDVDMYNPDGYKNYGRNYDNMVIKWIKI